MSGFYSFVPAMFNIPGGCLCKRKAAGSVDLGNEGNAGSGLIACGPAPERYRPFDFSAWNPAI